MEEYNLHRFHEAQDSAWSGYKTALEEIKNGRKLSHWIWYIFPQVKGLGYSRMCSIYGIDGLEEAKAYLNDVVLSSRLREISKTLLAHKGKNAEAILGGIDSMKVRSSMTLFDAASPNDIFAEVLDAFYNGGKDELTLSKLNSHS